MVLLLFMVPIAITVITGWIAMGLLSQGDNALAGVALMVGLWLAIMIMFPILDTLLGWE